MTKKEQQKHYKEQLTLFENMIEYFREKNRPELAQKISAMALGLISLAHVIDLIDNKEYDKLHSKFSDYYYFYQEIQ